MCRSDILHSHVLIRFCLSVEGFADMNLLKRYRQRCFKNHLCSNKHAEIVETSCSMCIINFSINPCKSLCTIFFLAVKYARLLHLSISRPRPEPYTSPNGVSKILFVLVYYFDMLFSFIVCCLRRSLKAFSLKKSGGKRKTSGVIRGEWQIKKKGQVVLDKNK